MTTTTEKEDLHYVGENTRWFMDYLPQKVFDSLTPIQRKNYRGYRTNQRFIGDSQKKVDEIQKEIDSLQKLIRSEKEKQRKWEEKNKMYYDEISHLDDNFKFGCSVEYRKRKSRKEGDPPYVYLYSNLTTTSHRVSIYLGNETEVKKQLGVLFGEDLSSDDRESLVDEYIKTIIRPFSRYHIHKLGWDKFKEKTLNLELVLEWVKNVGWDEVGKWGR
jgi:hypothetical protein